MISVAVPPVIWPVATRKLLADRETSEAIRLVNAARLIRLISARSIVAARRVTQDHARPFCTVKAGTARGFWENLTTNLGSRPDGPSASILG